MMASSGSLARSLTRGSDSGFRVHRVGTTVAAVRVSEADMRRFSWYSDGIDRVVIGFVFAAQFDTVEEAEGSGSFDIVDERFSFNTERLLQLRFDE